jgi:hypothetical protein
MESTRKIVVLFDADPVGRKASALIEKKCQEDGEKDGGHRFKIENKLVFSSFGEITGVENATAEDLVPPGVLLEFCKARLAKANAASVEYDSIRRFVGAKSAFGLLEKANAGRPAELKRELIDYLRKRTPEECYKGYEEFSQRLERKIQDLFN